MICVNSVNVYPSRIAIKTGTWYYNVHAEVCPTNATCPNVTWSSSDPSIAIVHPTSGYIHGGRPGTATIYATATDGSGKRGCCTVTVSQRIYVNSITLNTFQISIQRNNNYLLTAEVCPSNADNKAINWCSSNTEVATVSGGRVYAHKKGAAVITAAAADGSGTEAKCYVNVTENYLVVLITVEPACKTLAVGESVFLRETVYPNHATNKEVCWSSSNEYIATVNPTSGFVAAKHAGTATIYATAQDGSGKRGCCQITVIPPVHVTGITLCPQEQSIRIGETKQLEAVLSPANATNRSISWCSSNPDVVSVGYYSGIIRALSEGTAVITATASGGFQASCTITSKLLNTLFDSTKINNIKEAFYSLLGNKKVDIPVLNLYYVHTTSECIDILINHDTIITNIANTLSMPKTFIQTILMRELWCLNLEDSVGDNLVENYFAWKDECEYWENQTLSYQAMVPYPSPPAILKTDSSTGLGQIFAQVAIKAYNEAIDYQYISGNKIDGDDWKACKNVWYSLKNNNEYNIQMTALNILSCVNEFNYGHNYSSYTPEQCKQVFTRYNANQHTINDYGEECYQYYLIFQNFL